VAKKTHNKTFITAPPDGSQSRPSIIAQVRERMDKWFNDIENKTEKNQPEISDEFHPLVFSTGGVMSKRTAGEVEKWKKEVGKDGARFMLENISVILLEARASLKRQCLMLTDGSGDEDMLDGGSD
jgi:hypothetical protein